MSSGQKDWLTSLSLEVQASEHSYNYPTNSETSLDKNEKSGSLVQNSVLFCLGKSLPDTSVKTQVWDLNPGPITYKLGDRGKLLNQFTSVSSFEEG